MTPADETRQRLVEAATHGFAEHGVHTASLLEITRRAGQRNRGAVHYHFGSRTGMLVAVLEQHLDVLATREQELLAVARSRPDDDLVSVVRALVLPAVELAEQGGLGRSYLMIVGELVEMYPGSLDREVLQALQRLGGYEVYTLLEQRLPPLPDAVRTERLALVTAFVLRTVADRGRADRPTSGRPTSGRPTSDRPTSDRATSDRPTSDRPTSGRPQLPMELFAANLVDMVVGMLAAPAFG